MSLFSKADMAKFKEVADKSKLLAEEPKSVKTKSINAELNSISEQVLEYFKDSEAMLITSQDQLHDYVNKCI